MKRRAKAQGPKEPKQESEEAKALRELMRDRVPRTGAEIIDMLKHKLGRDINRMSVIGALNSRKRYAKEGDHYSALGA